MKRYVCISLTVIAVLLVSAMPGQAERFRGGGRGGPGWGPVLGLGLGLGLWELSRPYYSYPYYSYYDVPPVVIQQQAPDVYVQPAPQFAPAPPVPEPNYWYYCQDPQGYYPYVKQCPKGWMKVVPTPPAQ